MKNLIKQLELFFKSSNFDRGIRLGVAILVPIVALYTVGYLEYAPAVVVGAFLNAPGDIPGSVKRKINAILIGIGLTMIITAIILFLKPFFIILLIALAIISFFVSLIAVYGFRASLVSFSGLLAMVLAFAIQKETPQAILIQVALMGIGGLWYLLVSFLFQKLAPEKDQNQLLSNTLNLLGEYLKLRGKLLTKVKKRDDYLKQAFALQHQINETHETLREALLLERRRTGRSHYEEKQLLIFLSSINIFELIEAKHLDYDMIDGIFGKHKQFLKASKNLNKIMGNHLIRLSELLIQKDKIPSKDKLLNALSKANTTITDYLDSVQLPDAREGALVLKNLYDYQEQLIQEIRSIRRVMANVKDASKMSLKRQDTSQFLTLQEYRLNVITQNLSLSSTMFRHSMRFTIAILFAYLLGIFFNIQNTYWILLTIVVIMRPSYGLTKDRSVDRIVGTLIGAVIAIGIVLLTQNTIVYSVLAFVSLILAFSLIQQNYKSAAALITISIIFVYSFLNPNAFEVIQYRVIDTVIGATVAVVANYIILPSWEADSLKAILSDAIHKNKLYVFAVQDLYHNKNEKKLAYNIARKEAFLAIGNLNASFQRLTQDPKSKQREFELIYSIVTINQTLTSAIASIGNFIITHKTTPVSKEFDALVANIGDQLQNSIDNLNNSQLSSEIKDFEVELAQEKLSNHYRELSNIRDKNIQQGRPELDEDTLHGLQEAYLISNHLSWLKSLSESLRKSTNKFITILELEKYL